LFLKISQLEADLSKFKDKWASTQCDLQDTQEKLKETEKERTKTLTLLQGTLQQLEEERLRIYELETQISDTSASGMNKDRTTSVSRFYLFFLLPRSHNPPFNLMQLLKSLNNLLKKFKK
jgi:septal ring factor EnvC (AmiA/AmiB activator)